MKKGDHMKGFAFFFLLFCLTVQCFAEEKVYSNEDLTGNDTREVSRKSGATVVVTPPLPGSTQAQTSRPERSGLVEKQKLLPPQNLVKPKSAGIGNAPNSRAKPYVSPSHETDRLVDAIMAPYMQLMGWMLIVIAVQIIMWLVSLVDILRNEFTGHNKLIWFLTVTFLPFLGPILYFFIGTDQKIRPEDDEEPVVRLI
jgi:hypothetical protein